MTSRSTVKTLVLLQIQVSMQRGITVPEFLGKYPDPNHRLARAIGLVRLTQWTLNGWGVRLYQATPGSVSSHESSPYWYA